MVEGFLCNRGLSYALAVDFLIVPYKCFFGLGGAGEESEYIKLLYVPGEHRIQNTEYRIQNRETYVHKITNEPVFYIALDFFGNKWHLLCTLPFQGQKSIDFQSPPVSMALGMDVARIKIIASRAI
jgi:hypothetical protein